ncbi:MAG: helix-turn-helix domain-containing protein [Symploca sp. SIO2E6]|nr:helix-turn-helix domain-containing protein [Symploca sp. SIO2E6]
MKQQNSSVIVSPRESIGVQAAAHRLGISVGRVRTLLGQGRIEGAQKLGRRWQIPTRKGMPKIIPGHRGPQGSWYRKQRTQNGFIHANQHLLRLNRKDAGSRPAIAVKLGKHSQYGHYVEIKGRSRLVYSPNKPSSNCRARLWMEVPPTVPVGSSKFQTPGNRRQAVGVPEAAYLLRVSPQRVRQLLNQGRIAGASKIIQRWRIPLGSSGLPQVSAGSRGPKGTWCHPPVEKTIIRINQAKIHTNTASNSCLPVIDIWHKGTVCHCHEVEIMGPSRILYRPHHGGGYSLWIEVATEVKVVGKIT